MTGLAAGDHLRFTMLVAGHPVNPVEWWDPHWIQDRVDRKLVEAGRQPGRLRSGSDKWQHNEQQRATPRAKHPLASRRVAADEANR